MTPALFQAALQLGALGLLAVVLYFMMRQSASREAAACQERAANLEAQIGLVKVITKLNERLDSHSENTKTRHNSIDSQLAEMREASREHLQRSLAKNG